MSDATFPQRTAGETDLPQSSGVAAETTLAGIEIRVRVQTINSLQKDEAREAADLYAARETKKYRKTGDAYDLLLDTFEEMADKEQAEYLAEAAILSGRMRQDALDKYPDPINPQRGELDDDAYMAAVEKWEADGNGVQKKRGDFIEKAYRQETERALALTEKVRLERCAKAWRERKYRDVFAKRFFVETLYRAVRRVEEPSRFFYANADAVADLDDARRNHLLDFYFGLDTVLPDQIPTSPAVS